MCFAKLTEHKTSASVKNFYSFRSFLVVGIFRNMSKSFFSVPHLHVVFSHRLRSLLLLLKARKIILSFCLKYSNPTLCSLSRSINRCSDIFNSSWNSNSNGYSGLFFGILFQNEGQSNFHSFK